MKIEYDYEMTLHHQHPPSHHTNSISATSQLLLRGAIKKMSQIVEKIHKGKGGGVSVKIKIVYISNVD